MQLKRGTLQEFYFDSRRQLLIDPSFSSRVESNMKITCLSWPGLRAGLAGVLVRFHKKWRLTQAGAQLVRTVATAGRLPAMLQALQVREITCTAYRACPRDSMPDPCLCPWLLVHNIRLMRRKRHSTDLHEVAKGGQYTMPVLTGMCAGRRTGFLRSAFAQ